MKAFWQAIASAAIAGATTGIAAGAIGDRLNWKQIALIAAVGAANGVANLFKSVPVTSAPKE